MRGRAVAGVGQQRPHQGHAELLGDHGEDQDVDFGLVDLPVGAVEAEIPSRRISDQGDHKPHGPILGQHDMLEEAL